MIMSLREEKNQLNVNSMIMRGKNRHIFLIPLARHIIEFHFSYLLIRKVKTKSILMGFHHQNFHGTAKSSSLLSLSKVFKFWSCGKVHSTFVGQLRC